jgi:hypothetical protein
MFRFYGVGATWLLQVRAHVLLPYWTFYTFILALQHISTFRIMCAVSNMAVFCSSFISWFPCMVLRYCTNDSEMVPVAPIITSITLVLLHSTSSVILYILDFFPLIIIKLSLKGWILKGIFNVTF